MIVAALALVALAAASCGAGGGPSPAPRPPVVAAATAGPALAPRPLVLDVDGRWIGTGICYGPHRDGQRPGGPAPTDDELREDLRLLAPRWGLLRIYGADDWAGRLLALIRRERLPFKVLLGAWIAPEAGPAAATNAADNRAQVASAIRLAGAYPELVVAIVVGNETQVSWSAHRLPLDQLVRDVRAVRAATSVPVTSADDFGYWLEDDSARLARELDFLMVHVHAMWNGQQLDQALAFTQQKFAAVAARHPDRPLFLGEAGWATRRHTEGDQARYIKGVAGEAEQQVFFEQFTTWSREARIPTTYFEAFDEGWKGGPHPDEVEKHWGLFRADRTAKPALTR